MKKEEFEQLQKHQYELEQELGSLRKKIKDEQERLAEEKKKKKTLEHFTATKDSIKHIKIMTEDCGHRTIGTYYFDASIQHKDAREFLKEAIEKSLNSIIEEE